MTENSTQNSTAFYDPDDVGPRDSPPLTPMKINLQPSPPPAPIPISRHSPEPSLGRKGFNRSKNRPLIGDAILVSIMGGGKRPDIARTAGSEALASDEEEERISGKGTEVEVMLDEDRGVLTALAADALRAHEGNTAQDNHSHLERPIIPANQDAPSSIEQTTSGAHVEDMKPAMAPVNAIYSTECRPRSSPEAAVVQIKLEPKGSSPAGELPPIRHSPKSGLPNGTGTGPITLPSLSDQLGDLNHLPTEGPATGESNNFSQSSPGRQPPRFTAVPGQASPKSPNDTFRRELPSPGRSSHFFYNSNTHRRPSQAESGPQYINAGDYSGNNTETASTDQSASAPAIAIDRMSIDGITNPQIGGFQCTYPGCTAQPFQTQYLLNSHANVHSSNRPHYCMVKGCPRGEGGKGFKRKNEMIRHGLVHDSPGYVCPFCPDREHKYPRPDNLQRHVRVHHVDKDKDDPQLREVLAQRPEGPSRGRRRRLNGSA